MELPGSWRAALGGELGRPYMRALEDFLDRERTALPGPEDRLRAFALTPLGAVRVVILGQDPYHGPGQAHGLSFSVRPGVPVPPSLANIYKELESDLGIPRAGHGFLEHWAHQGVLLLNAVLTVRQGEAASHRGQGWERFTDAAIAAVNAQADPAVFMLWGNDARKKAELVDSGRHLILQAPHPSPLSAYAGFFRCRHFSQANAFLESRGLAPIDWALPAEVCAEASS